MCSEDNVFDIVDDVMSDLRTKANEYETNGNIVFEDKAILLSEIKAALTCLGSIKKSPKAMSVRNKINNCLYNQQLIYLAMKSIQQNEELELQYKDLHNVCHYSIKELNY